MPFFFRKDSTLGRTLANCLLSAVLALGVGSFFSCRRHLIIPPTPQMDISRRFQIRVLLANDINHATLRIKTGFSILDIEGNALIPETFFTGQGEPMEVAVSSQGLTIAGRNFTATQITIVPDNPYIFTFQGSDYRGKLILKAKIDTATFDAINVVPIEPYLAGVVGAEMPEYWQSEALKAQAIAARTYCLYNKSKFGPNRSWDVTKTAASQVYQGIKAESPRVWRAVNETAGRVLVCKNNGLLDELFPAYYSSTCGGHTEDAKNVFGDSIEPLGGVDCPYCKDVARPNIFFWPMAQFDKADVLAALQRKYARLKQLSDITNISPTRRSDYTDFSRLTMVKVEDSNGQSDLLRAEDLRLTIDPSGNKLRSTICKIINLDGKWTFLSGRGFGHGVGMCQCGAEGMARQGKTADQILQYYYPGSRQITAY